MGDHFLIVILSVDISRYKDLNKRSTNREDNISKETDKTFQLYFLIKFFDYYQNSPSHSKQT